MAGTTLIFLAGSVAARVVFVKIMTFCRYYDRMKKLGLKPQLSNARLAFSHV
jgi:hypothetical protein